MERSEVCLLLLLVLIAVACGCALAWPGSRQVIVEQWSSGATGRVNRRPHVASLSLILQMLHLMNLMCM